MKDSENPVSQKSIMPGTKFVSEPQREVPIFAETDVLVIGGGPAGTTAAIASSRTGAETWLIERYNHLGGLWTGSRSSSLSCREKW